MKNIFCIGSVIVSLSFFLVPVTFAQEGMYLDGKWWNTQTAEVRQNYIAGFVDGIRDVQQMLETMKVKKEVVIKKDPITQLSTEEEVATTPRQQIIEDLDTYCNNTSKFSTEQYSDGLDKFYGEKLNLKIPLNKAMEVVRMYLKGKTTWEINPHVKGLREAYGTK